jgi:hypothetical protein
LTFAVPRPLIPMQAILSFSLGDSAPRLFGTVPNQKPVPAATVVFSMARRWMDRFIVDGSFQKMSEK